MSDLVTAPAVALSGDALNGVDAPYRGIVGVASALPVVVKLGRVEPKSLPPLLSLAAYLTPAAPAPATTGDRRKAPAAAAALSRMYLNDQYGCCVISGKYHQLGFWPGVDEATTVVVPDSVILQMYNRLKAGPGDSGCIITDVLNYFRTNGLPLADGTAAKLDGYVRVDNTRAEQVKAATYLFGSLTIGIDLPQAWLNSAVWDATNSGIVGGHDVAVVDYDESGVYVSSWGRVYRMTWRAFTDRRWVKECYAQLAPSWYGSDRVAPSGVDADRLRADLQKLSNGEVPDVTPPQPPAPPSPPPPPSPPVPPPAPADTLRVPAGGTVPTGYVAIAVRV